MGLTHHMIHCCAAPVVLPAFVRSNTNVRQIIPCINGRRRRVSILLVTKSGSSLTRFLKSGSYIKKSLRLNSAQSPHLPTSSTSSLRSLHEDVMLLVNVSTAACAQLQHAAPSTGEVGCNWPTGLAHQCTVLDRIGLANV